MSIVILYLVFIQKLEHFHFSTGVLRIQTGQGRHSGGYLGLLLGPAPASVAEATSLDPDTKLEYYAAKWTIYGSKSGHLEQKKGMLKKIEICHSS